MKVALGLFADVVALGGVASAVYGVSLLSVPAAFITGGAALVGIGVAGARRASRS